MFLQLDIGGIQVAVFWYVKLTCTVEVNDAMFCEHGLEVCKACEFDGREGESAFQPLDRLPYWRLRCSGPHARRQC